MGEEMPKKKKEEDSSKYVYWIAAILIVILFLKGIGILKAVFNIDPDGFTFSFDIGFISSAALFAIVLARLHKLNDVLSKQGERIARIEGILETQFKKP
jgi:cytochrome b subunit of formate dehydrogenase